MPKIYVIPKKVKLRLMRAVTRTCVCKLLLIDQRLQRNLGLDGCGLVIGRRLYFDHVSAFWNTALLAAVNTASDQQCKHQDGADHNGSFDASGLTFEPAPGP